MFRAEEGDESGVVCASQDLNGALAVAVNAGGVGKEANAFAGDFSKTIFLEDVDSEVDGPGMRFPEEEAGRGKEQVCEGEVFTHHVGEGGVVFWSGVALQFFD